MLALSVVHRRIELDQDVALFDGLPILDMDRADDADLEGLNNLRPAARNNLPWSRGNDVDKAQRGPRQRHAEQKDDRRTGRAANRRGGSLDDLEGRRKK